MKKASLLRYLEDAYDIICCDQNDNQRRISVDLKIQRWFTSMRHSGTPGEHGSLPFPDRLLCPNCQNPIPEYIKIQIMLLVP